MPAKRKIPSLFDLRDQWLAQLESNGASPNTLAAYRRDTDIVAGPIRRTELDRPEALSRELLQDILNDAYQGKSLATRARYWSTWRSFCGYLIDTEVLEANPMQRIARPAPGERAIEPLAGEATVGSLLEAALGHEDRRRADGSTDRRSSAWGLRDALAIGILALCGLRASEVTTLNLRDLRGGDGERTLAVRGKGKKIRAVPLLPELDGLVQAYIEERADRFGPAESPKRNAPLLVTTNGRRLSRDNLRVIVHRAAEEAGVTGQFPEGAFLHALRHRFATELVRHGSSAKEAKQLLGHASLATTDRYLSATADELRSAVSALPDRKALTKATRHRP